MNSPAEVAKNYIGIGKGKATNGFWKLLILGMLAGAFIGLAGVGATTAAVNVPGSVGKFLGACIFPVGLAMVLLAGSELFTGNNLIIIPVLTGDIKFVQMLRNWVIVYIGNLIGSTIVAFLVVYGHVGNLFGGVDGGLAAAMMSAATGKVTMGFGDAFLKGICCNFLVCIAVWISFAAKDVVGKANMYYIPAGLFCKALYGVDNEKLTWGAMFVKNLIPVTLGNIVGGAGLVGLPYWFVYLREKK